jgi:secreted trypsin-like serine protease
VTDVDLVSDRQEREREMTTTTSGPGSIRRPVAIGQRSGCTDCPPVEEPDFKVAVENLSRKYTELAGVVARYMSEAGLERETRTANAARFTAELIRIVGGVETPPGKYPECALIGRRFPNGSVSWFCSGVLVHPRVVLTAGHCQDPQFAMNVVALNAVTMTDLQDAEIMGVRRVRVNPQYPQVTGNDISVLILRRGATVDPVPIVTTEDIAAATETTLVGFGNSDFLSTKGFGTQREVTVDVTHVRRSEDDDLDEAEQSLGFESDLEFVAGGGGFDSCNGDSGGPAYIDVEGVRKVAGLTSRATEGATNPCGEGGIYTRVDTQRPFIRQVLQAAGINDEL